MSRPKESPEAPTNGARRHQGKARIEYNETPLQRLLPRLDKVRETGRGQYLACCPAHDDRSPSLSVRECADNTVLIHCFALCAPPDVLASVGMDVADLFPDYGRRESAPKRRGERRINPLDTLRAIDHEANIVGVVASDMKNHRSIDDATMQRLGVAISRIGAAREMYG